MGDQVDLATLFRKCDVRGTGRLEYEDFKRLCRDLGVESHEVPALFQSLDSDRDGAISYGDFEDGFRNVSEGSDETGRAASLRRLSSVSYSNFSTTSSTSPFASSPAGRLASLPPVAASSPVKSPLRRKRSWRDFEDQCGENVRYLPNSWVHASELHSQLSQVGDENLQLLYEGVLSNFLSDIKRRVTDNEDVSYQLKRIQEQSAFHQNEMEAEMEERVATTEARVRNEEKARTEALIAEMRRRHDGEVTELQAALERVNELQSDKKAVNKHDEIIELKMKINEMTMENQQMKRNLLEAQTNLTVLQSELDTVKTESTSQRLNLEREQALIRQHEEERQELTRQIDMLRSAHRKMNDSNDGLRAVLENSMSQARANGSPRSQSPSPVPGPRHSSPQVTRKVPGTPVRLPVPRRHPQQHSPSHYSGDEDDFSASSLSDSALEEEGSPSCVDSGLSTMRRTGEAPWGAARRPRGQAAALHRNGFRESVSSEASAVDIPDMEDEESERMLRGVRDARPLSRTPSNASSRRTIRAFGKDKDALSGSGGSGRVGRVYKIVLAGDASVGKSSFLMRLCKNEFDGNTCSTLGVDFQMKSLVVDGEETTLQLWDTAGQERFRSIAKSYFRRAHGVLLLYDVTCHESFKNVREWVDNVQDAVERSVPIMIVGNKTDLRPNDGAPNRTYVSTNQGEMLAMSYRSLFCETSAKDGDNVVEAVLHLARDVRRFAGKDPDQSVTDLTQQGNKEKSKCCDF
ncbi:ras and EF-hand domain-containing protein homolog [Lethenteron reissneri]|uniref:ras and EF-hand domain-containing protein homolog n=1 Tax=Lethenteron reissneri TaxID=7753 RepID=UPI002AB750ED|nr:ras and EF-hand domain-containing protein homolog [Lethenteron reissneri]